MLVKAESHIIKSSIQVREHPELSMLMAGSGIGGELAQTLIDEFGSPKNALYASREDLLAINGIGDSTVVKIKELKEVWENGSRKEKGI